VSGSAQRKIQAVNISMMTVNAALLRAKARLPNNPPNRCVIQVGKPPVYSSVM
jgi:hypothetical protein